MATLNSRLADFIFSCDQIRYRQLPQPAPCTTSARPPLSVRDHSQEFLGASQRLFRYPGVFGLFDDMNGRNRAVGQDVTQELHGLTSSVCVLLVLGCT